MVFVMCAVEDHGEIGPEFSQTVECAWKREMLVLDVGLLSIFVLDISSEYLIALMLIRTFQMLFKTIQRLQKPHEAAFLGSSENVKQNPTYRPNQRLSDTHNKSP
jgi:hypothetical protein